MSKSGLSSHVERGFPVWLTMAFFGVATPHDGLAVEVKLTEQLQGKTIEQLRELLAKKRVEVVRSPDAEQVKTKSAGGDLVETATPSEIVAAVEALSPATIKGLIGEDDRRDFFELTNPPKLDQRDGIRTLMNASVAIVKQGDLREVGGEYEFRTNLTLGKNLALCSGERYIDQPVGAKCSGVLIGTKADTILTAAHCFRDYSRNSSDPYIQNVYFVFGFRMNDGAQATAGRFKKEQVYVGQSNQPGSVKFKSFADGHDVDPPEDWTVIKLNRSVPSSVALPVTSKALEVRREQPMFTIGYPSGLPQKYADGARVTESDPTVKYFRATVDAFGGNSGGPVFDVETLKLAGLISKADPDYTWRNGVANTCRTVWPCPSNGCAAGATLITRLTRVPVE